MSADQNDKEVLEAAHRLVACLEEGRSDEVERIVDEITHLRESSLFKELGALTRELHESLKAFKVDTRIVEIAGTDIPDARDRLNYVISMTEQAANRTLNAIEDSMPMVDELTGTSTALKERWGQFRARKMSVEDFRVLSKDVDDFLGTVEEDARKLQQNLTDALMAQDFQDLTGQIIRKVINLVQEVEENLVQLVRISGQRIVTEEKREAADKKKDGMMQGEGPRVPGQGEDKEFVQGQDDVDDLLSSLGF